MNPLIPILEKLIALLKKLYAILLSKGNQPKDVVLPVKVTPMPETPVVHPSKIHIWALAVAVQEGAKKSLNNPGNLKLSGLTRSWGAITGFAATDGGVIAAFPTMQQGEKALEDFLTLGCEDELIAYHAPEARTLGGFTDIYAGHPPVEYKEAVARALGCTLETLISTFL
jgi:hypothetical protein